MLVVWKIERFALSRSTTGKTNKDKDLTTTKEKERAYLGLEENLCRLYGFAILIYRNFVGMSNTTGYHM